MTTVTRASTLAAAVATGGASPATQHQRQCRGLSAAYHDEYRQLQAGLSMSYGLLQNLSYFTYGQGATLVRKLRQRAACRCRSV